MFVLDVGAGDDIPRKRGPGVIQSDLLVINKIDLAPHVRVDLGVIRRDCLTLRGERQTVFTNCHSGEGIDEVLSVICHEVLFD